MSKRISVESFGGPTMSVRLEVVTPDLKPEELAVSAQDPYQADLLDRKDFGDGLAKLTEYGSGTGVILIDGGWGSGKTTFLRMWIQDARNQDKVVAMVNAWEGDYLENPLEYIADQLAKELQQYVPSGRLLRFIKHIRRYWVKTSSTIVQMIKAGAAATAPIDGGTSLGISLALEKLIKSLRQVRSDSTPDVNRLENLQLQLRQTAKKLWNNRKHGRSTRMIIVIDELDRCRPDYAVRFIETIKHVFEVEHVTFIVAANISELAHAINGLYGQEFDGKRYLERFFDISLSLPGGTRENFVKKVVRNANLSSSFGQKIPSDNLENSLTAEDIVSYMLLHSTLSPREIHKTLKHINIILLFHRDQLAISVLAAITLATLRSVAKDAYLALENGKAGSGAVTLLCQNMGKSSTNGNQILEFIDDILYWCWKTAEQELEAGKRIRKEEPNRVKTVDPDDEEKIRQRRSARKHLVDYRVVRDIIELTAELYDKKSVEE